MQQWDEAAVRRWLAGRVEASRLDQAVADRRGYEARDDYDQAAAEEWACGALLAADCLGDQAGFARHVKALAAQDGYRVGGVHDDERLERHVRARLRKIARMAKANDGFGNTARFQ